MNEIKKIELDNGTILKVIETTDNIHVDVTVPNRKTTEDTKAGYNTSDLVEDLIKENIDHGNLLEHPPLSLSNSRPGHNLTGRWTFETTKTTTTTTTATTTKAKKTTTRKKKVSE